MRTPKVIPVPLLPFGMVKSFIIKGEKSIIVDTGFPGCEERILSVMKENGIRHKDVSLIVVTHTHVDHMGSAAALKWILNVPIVMHHSEVEYARTKKQYKLAPAHLVGKIFYYTSMVREEVDPFEPDIVMDKSLDLAEFGVNGSIFHTPGHTTGSLSIHLFDTNEFLVADLIAGGVLIGGVCCHTTPLVPPFQDDADLVKEQLRKIASVATTIYTTHGGPVDVAKLIKKLER